MKSIAERPHRVTFQNPGPSVADGDGGFTQSWTDLTPPALWVAIETATAQNLERVGAGTVTAGATHIISGPFHSGVTTKTRAIYNGRTFNVQGVVDPTERQQEMVLLVAELLT